MNVTVRAIGRRFLDLPQRIACDASTHWLITATSLGYDAGGGARQMIDDVVINVFDDFLNRLTLIMMRVGIENGEVV